MDFLWETICFHTNGGHFFLLSSLNAVKESFVDVLAALTHILLMVLLKIHCINSHIMSSWPCECQNKIQAVSSKFHHYILLIFFSCIGKKRAKAIKLQLYGSFYVLKHQDNFFLFGVLERGIWAFPAQPLVFVSLGLISGSSMRKWNIHNVLKENTNTNIDTGY